jgi:hypothetical protein
MKRQELWKETNYDKIRTMEKQNFRKVQTMLQTTERYEL